MVMMKASSILECSGLARHACQNSRMDKISRAFCNARHSHGRLAGKLMELMNASSILKCSGPQGMLAKMIE
jgi:hypothetical protein